MITKLRYVPVVSTTSPDVDPNSCMVADLRPRLGVHVNGTYTFSLRSVAAWHEALNTWKN